MTDKPTDADGEQEVLSQEVQDYLDLMLGQVTEEPVAEQGDAQQSESESEQEQQRAAVVTKGSPALTMVGGTAVSSPRGPQVLRHPSPAEETPKPFAEPARPVSLRMPMVEVKPEPPAPPAPTAETEPAPVVEKTEAKTPPPAAEPAPAEPEAETAAPVADEAETAQPHKTSEWLENGRPAWAQERFECLLFSVGGLTLAVPLVELGTIYPINDEITPIFGQIDWFMGLLSVKDNNIKTVNTAKIVMPERYRDAMIDHYTYVITINGVDWGLAVDSVSSAITLEPSDVRWRGERSKRPWLAGTVVDHMCALLDASQLASMFLEANARKAPH